MEAALQGKGRCCTAACVEDVPPSEVLGETEPGARPFVARRLAGLAVASAVVCWPGRAWEPPRLDHWGAFVLALLWGVGYEAMRLFLPNV